MSRKACHECGRPSDRRYCERHRTDEQVGRPGRGTKAHEETRQAVFERDGYRCVLCGSPDHIEAGHKIPHSQGGPFTMGNLQTECRRCNRRKGAKRESA